MPVGPGDDILDSIEAGTADDTVMKKFSINADQLKAFKSLHYGLINQKLGYNEINDYYPELRTYFGQSTVTPSKPQNAAIEKPDFTKPVREKAITESTAAPAGLKHFQQAAESGKPIESLQQKFDRGAKESLLKVHEALKGNDDVAEKMIRDFRYNQRKEQALTDYASAPKSDMPSATMLANQRVNLDKPQIKPEALPVAPEEIQKIKEDAQTDEMKSRHFINKIVVNKPDKANGLQAAMYTLDAMARMKDKPDIGIKVNENINRLNKGELKYNALTQQLTEDEGFFPSLVTGVKENTRQLDNYDIFQQSDDKVIAALEKRMASYDPDKPQPVPAGIGELGQMTGMEWKALAKGAAVSGLLHLVGGDEAAPYVTAAINAPEYYKRGYSTALEESYQELRRQGKSPEESLKLAREQAKTEGNLSAAEGAVSAFVGGRFGLRELPKFNITNGFKSAVTQALKHTGHFLGETTIDGLADGIVAGALQARKDAAAEEKGMFRDSEKNIRDNVTGELTFSLAMGIMSKVGKGLVNPELYKKVKYFLGSQDPSVVQEQLGTMVMNGQMNKEDADNISKEIAEQHEKDKAVPGDIKDVSRQAMLDKIDKRKELEARLEVEDEALHPPIKEEIKKLNEEILEHSTHKKTITNESETKAKTQAEAESQANGGIEPGPEGKTSSQPVAEQMTGDGESAPVSDVLHYTNPEGTQYVLRGDELYLVGKNGKETKFSEKAMQTPATQELVNKIKEANQQTTQNAIQEQSAEGIPVHAPSGNSQAMEQGNESQRAIPEETAGTQGEELKINTIDDLDAALAKLNKQGPSESQSNIGTEPLPKLTESPNGNGKPVSVDVKEYTPASILEKARETFKDNPVISRALDFLEPIIKANPNIKINHNAKLPSNVLGYSHNDGSVELNWKAHGDEASLLQTGVHELMHAATRAEIENNSAFKNELIDALTKVREQMGLPDNDNVVGAIMHHLSAAGNLDPNKYGASNVHELIAELFTNKNFRDQLSNIKYEGDSFLKKIFLIIAKYLSESYKKLVGAKANISVDNLADYLMELTEKTVTGQGTDTAGGLAALKPQTQEDAIKAIIKATPASITDQQLLDRITKATGLDEPSVQAMIDAVRKPPKPPSAPPTDINSLSEQNKQVSLNKFKKLREKPKTQKEPSKFQKLWEGIKNASAWTDNPYRFITKLTEDINKHYGLENKEVIPLGRQFEKSSAGRAALKVESYVNDIIRGNINGKKLGRLKGEKYNDFLDYLAAKRVIDRLNKQEEKLNAGEHSNRQTGNITRQDAEVMLDTLKKKYGNLDDFEARGNAFQQHMDNMLQTLVASGNLSKETYDQIKADNDFYAPFSVIQSKFYADMQKQSAGISGVVKRIKGIDLKTMTTATKALDILNKLGEGLNDNLISPEEYFNTSLKILDIAKTKGLITDQEYENHIAQLENPGFAIDDILNVGANMIYKAESMAQKNTMMQRLFAYKAQDTEGKFIQDVDDKELITLPDGSKRMVSKPLSSIKVEPGMAPIRLRVDGKDVTVAVDKRIADKLNTMSNYETSSLLQGVDLINKAFRTVVITASAPFQVKNFLIDLRRTIMLSRYGAIAGKNTAENIVNLALFVPQYLDALLHATAGNLGWKTETYKQWMNSDSFSKGMFDNLFNNENRIKEIDAPLVKRMLHNLINLHWLEVPGSILEQTPKLAIHQRGLSVEGFKPEMATAMLASVINKNIKPNMSARELSDGLDKVNYEVQNMAGSPNFPQTHKWMKIMSIYLQFLSARMKGEVTDYRRLGNVFFGKGEGVKLSKRETIQIATQFAANALLIGGYAIKNILNDDDEKEFNGIPSWHQDNNINIPLGYFEYEDDKGEKHTLRDYAKIPLRGVDATMNVMANSFVKFYKRKNPEEFKKMAEAFLGNASPINLNGKDERELGESLASNLTPVFKYFVEYSFNRDTHNHRDLVPDGFGKGMLSKYRAGKLKPWDVATKKTPQWAKDMSKYLYETLGVSISAIELDHMENTMGNPTELYDKALKKNFYRSESKYPLYEPKGESKNQSSATVTPVVE